MHASPRSFNLYRLCRFDRQKNLRLMVSFFFVYSRHLQHYGSRLLIISNDTQDPRVSSGGRLKVAFALPFLVTLNTCLHACIQTISV